LRLVIRVFNLRPPLQNQWSGLVDLSYVGARRHLPRGAFLRPVVMVVVRMASPDAPDAYDRFYQLAYGRHPSFGSEAGASTKLCRFYTLMLNSSPETPFLANHSLTQEQALTHASDLLRCAVATAYECGDSLTGSKRDLAFSIVHLVEMANAMVERSLR